MESSAGTARTGRARAEPQRSRSDAPDRPAPAPGRWHLEPETWALLAVLGALACARLAMLLLRADQTGLEWTGADALQPHDGMEYLGWIVGSARDVLIANPFRLDSTPANFLHPGIAVSGLLHRLGLSASAAYLVWKPVAVFALFAAVLAFVRMTLSGRLARWCALALALFTLSPTWWILGTFAPVSLADDLRLILVRDDMWPPTFLWGYPFGTLGVALLAGGLVVHSRVRAAPRLSPWPPLLALGASWLQPWQGVILLSVIWGSEGLLALERRRDGAAAHPDRPSRSLLLVTTACGILPLVYYYALSRLDSSWRLAGESSQLDGWPWWIVPASVAPLALVALLGYRGAARDFGRVAVRLWPPVALGLFAFITVTGLGTFGIHALQGITIPLAVLSVAGVQGLGRVGGARATALVAAALVAVAIVPVAVHRLSDEWAQVRDAPASDLMRPGDRAALRWLEHDPRPGGVLARAEIGSAVPALAGRRTWVGHIAWTPDFFGRVALADELFTGRLPRRRAAALARSSGARFLLADCASAPRLDLRLPGVLSPPRRFGCAAVYLVRGPA